MARADTGMNHTVKYDPRATDITTYTVSAARLTASEAGASDLQRAYRRPGAPIPTYPIRGRRAAYCWGSRWGQQVAFHDFT